MLSRFRPAVLVLILCPALRAEPPVWQQDTVPSKFAKLDNIRVHYKSLGDGPTALVLVHGWTGDLNSWRYQVPAFQGKCRIVLLDLPGHGKSDRPQIDYTMDLFAKAVDAVMRDAGVEQAVLAGHSMGTPVVRQFYRLYPQKTLGLVAVDGALRPFTRDQAQIDRFVGQFAGPDFKKALGRFGEAMFTENTPAEVKRSIKESMQAAAQHVAVSAMRGMWAAEIWKDDPINVPLMLILAKSPFWNEEYQAYVRKLAPKADIRFIDGVGHFLMMEKPEAFNAHLTEFLTTTGLLKK
jgi:pimeloyl-ACP methyl ester carboxylesterase